MCKFHGISLRARVFRRLPATSLLLEREGREGREGGGREGQRGRREGGGRAGRDE